MGCLGWVWHALGWWWHPLDEFERSGNVFTEQYNTLIESIGLHTMALHSRISRIRSYVESDRIQNIAVLLRMFSNRVSLESPLAIASSDWLKTLPHCHRPSPNLFEIVCKGFHMIWTQTDPVQVQSEPRTPPIEQGQSSLRSSVILIHDTILHHKVEIEESGDCPVNGLVDCRRYASNHQPVLQWLSCSNC